MRPHLPSRAAPLAAALLAATLALAGCGQSKEPGMVSADAAPDQLPAGAVAPVKSAQTDAFSLPQDQSSHGGAPPSSL